MGILLIGLAAAALFFATKETKKPRELAIPEPPEVTRNEDLRTLFADLDVAVAEYEFLTKVEGHGPSHPDVVDMVGIINRIEEMIAEIGEAPAVGGSF